MHQAILHGHSALFTTAADLLLDLNGQETARALDRRLRHYCRPQLLCIDEIGYPADDAHAADLLFQIVPKRYEHKAITAIGCVRRNTPRRLGVPSRPGGHHRSLVSVGPNLRAFR